MTIVAVIGDATTTTSLALAATWRRDDDVVVVEADRSGGSLAAWLGTPLTPSLSTVVATIHAEAAVPGDRSALTCIEPMIRRAASGPRFIPAPYRAREAARAGTEAERTLFPVLATETAPVCLVDVGRPGAAHQVPVPVQLAEAVVICHRQEAASPGAAAARIERLAELVEVVGDRRNVVLALIGDAPFTCDEIAAHLGGRPRWWHLAVDPLAAAVLAGRRGVSARRLARLPLLRTASDLADELARTVKRPIGAPTR